jgi:hypothetical protein
LEQYFSLSRMVLTLVCFGLLLLLHSLTEATEVISFCYIAEHHCCVFSRSSYCCHLTTHYSLSFTLFYHAQSLHAASKCRLAELCNSTTQFCSDIIPEHSHRITIHMGSLNNNISRGGTCLSQHSVFIKIMSLVIVLKNK